MEERAGVGEARFRADSDEEEGILFNGKSR